MVLMWSSDGNFQLHPQTVSLSPVSVWTTRRNWPHITSVSRTHSHRPSVCKPGAAPNQTTNYRQLHTGLPIRYWANTQTWPHHEGLHFRGYTNVFHIENETHQKLHLSQLHHFMFMKVLPFHADDFVSYVYICLQWPSDPNDTNTPQASCLDERSVLADELISPLTQVRLGDLKVHVSLDLYV